MEEVKITPADVAEKLLSKGQIGDHDLDTTKCLENLIQALLYKKANSIVEDVDSNVVKTEEKTKNEDEVKELFLILIKPC